MKKFLFTGVVSAIALAFTACSADDPYVSTATGGLAVDLNIDQNVASAQGSRAEYSDVTINDLNLRLIDGEGNVVREGKAAEFTADLKYKVGEYTLEAEYGSDEQDGFEMPHFYGSTSVSVRDSEVTNVSLTAYLANAMVQISYSEAFQTYFKNYSASILSAASRTTDFAADETRAAYIAPGTAKVFVDVTKPNGLSATLQPAEFEAEPHHLYRVTLDVNGGEVGAPTLVITFDETLNLEPVEIELSDELMNAPAPVLTLKGATVDEATGEALVEIVDGAAYDGDLSFSIVARGGIKQVPMVTVSSSLTADGWPSDVDLVAATPAQQSSFNQLGLSVLGLWRNPDKMAVVDFAGVISHLRYVEGGNNEHRFTLYVKDKFTKVCDPVTLVVNVNKATLELSNAFMREGDSYLTVDLTYNGSVEPTLQDNVDIQVKNDRGTWTSASYTYAAPAAYASRALTSPVYALTVTLPSDAVQGSEGYEIRALRKGSSSVASTTVVKPQPDEFTISIAAADMWATKAYVAFASNLPGYTAADLASGATLLIKADGDANYSTATVEKTDGSNVVTLKNLTAGKNYSVKAYILGDSDRESRAVALTTESALQLPNAGMETWSQTSSGSHWELVWPSAAANGDWGTNNPMTTSQGSDLAYCRISGTISTSDCHTGSAAALIRTVGWGSGNTASGFVSTGILKYVDAGLLHLGTSRTGRPSGYSDRKGPITTSDLNCGLAFASRPSSLTFYYKYSPKNSSDKGLAQVYVYDAAGNQIASGEQYLTSASSYTAVTIPLNYEASAPKGAKIYVKFLSTYSQSFLEKTKDNLSCPSGRNLSNGTYMGSQLYIDDLTLNY